MTLVNVFTVVNEYNLIVKCYLVKQLSYLMPFERSSNYFVCKEKHRFIKCTFSNLICPFQLLYPMPSLFCQLINHIPEIVGYHVQHRICATFKNQSDGCVAARHQHSIYIHLLHLFQTQSLCSKSEAAGCNYSPHLVRSLSSAAISRGIDLAQSHMKRCQLSFYE